MAPNWICDENKFSLAGPPSWWLRGLWEFDPSLVVIPSRQGFFYRLAQRRKPTLSSKIVNDALFAESDTKMLARYHLIPVTTIMATACWHPSMFETLRNRAPWRMGGAEEVIKQVETQDQQAEIDKALLQDEKLTAVGRDAWGLYLKKLGLRSHMYIPKTSG